MLVPRFCYRILPDAKMANDINTGEYTYCFMQVSIEGGLKLNKDSYKSIHLDTKLHLASQLNISESYLECISYEEYDEFIKLVQEGRSKTCVTI